MTPRKLLLAVAISLTIFVLYFAYGCEPDYEIIRIFGWKWGANYNDYTELKLANVAAWFLYLLYPKDDK